MLAVAGTLRRWGRTKTNAAANGAIRYLGLRKRAVVRAAASRSGVGQRRGPSRLQSIIQSAKETKYVDSLGAVGGEAAGCLQSPGRSADGKNQDANAAANSAIRYPGNCGSSGRGVGQGVVQPSVASRRRSSSSIFFLPPHSSSFCFLALASLLLASFASSISRQVVEQQREQPFGEQSRTAIPKRRTEQNRNIQRVQLTTRRRQVALLGLSRNVDNTAGKRGLQLM